VGLRWLVAGYGDVVVRHSVPALRELGAEVTLWGRHPEHTADVAARLGVNFCSDFSAALPGVEAVYVATPVATHVPLAQAAVAAGRHVLLEKPVAGGLPITTTELAATAADSGAVLGVAYYRRLDPLAGALRSALRAAGPQQVTVEFRENFRPAAADPKSWRTHWQTAGGGVLADAGSHRIDLLCWIFGPPSSVRAVLTDRYPGGSERSAELVLTWPDTTIAWAHFAWGAGHPVDRLTLVGAGVEHRVDPLDGGRLRTADLGGQDLAQSCYAVPGNRRIGMFADFADAVRSGRPPMCSLDEAVLVDRVIAAAEESSTGGGTAVTLGDR
jgi:predicted dehydrogenase